MQMFSQLTDLLHAQPPELSKDKKLLNVSLPQEIVLVIEQMVSSSIVCCPQLPIFVLLVTRCYEFILRFHQELESHLHFATKDK